MFKRVRRILFRKGVLRYLILEKLSEKPMHGYELIKVLSSEFGGLHQPSAGAVYPMLQTLENQGYLTGEEKEGKTVYSLTPKGEELLKEIKEKWMTVVEERKAFIEERKGLNREMRNLASLLITNYRDLTPEKAEGICQILQETRKKVTDIIFE